MGHKSLSVSIMAASVAASCVFLLSPTAGNAEGKLPQCPKDNQTAWTNCQGTVTYDSGARAGNTYLGEFLDGKRHGQGEQTFVNGNRYQGEWKNDVPNGTGTFTSANGAKYVGEFNDGKSSGNGIFTFVDGATYVGDFRDGKQNGKGTFTYLNGDKYVGDWIDNQKQGKGIYTYSNGNKYVGDFRDSKFNGSGEYFFADGRKYVGEFRDDKYDGLGTFYFANGPIKKGLWANNEFIRAAEVPSSQKPLATPLANTQQPSQNIGLSSSEAAFQAFLNKNPDGTPQGTRPTNFQFVVSTNDSKHFTALNLKPPSNATYANPNVFVGCGNQEYDNMNPDKTKLTGITIEDGKFYSITAQSPYFAPTDTAAGESKRDGKYLISFESCKMEPFTPAAADVGRLQITALKNQYTMMYLGPTFKCPDFKCGTLGSLIMDQSYINEHLGRTDIELYQPVQALRHAYPEQRNALRDQLAKELKSIEQSCRLPAKFARDPLDNLSGTEKFGACVKSAYSKLRATMVAQGSSYGSSDMREEIARSVSDHVFGQVLLKHFEFLPKTADVDGSFGQGTRTAIMAAQAEAKLDQSGFLSNATYDFLINRVVAQARTKNDVAPQPIASVSATKNEPITSVKAPEGTGQKEVLNQKMMEFFELYKQGQKPTVKFANIRTLGECGIAYENLDPNSQRVSAENTQGFKNLRVKMGETSNHPEKSIRNFADEKPYYVEFPSADGPNSGFKIAGLNGSPNLSDGLVFAKNTDQADAFVKVLNEITALCAGKPISSIAPVDSSSKQPAAEFRSESSVQNTGQSNPKSDPALTLHASKELLNKKLMEFSEFYKKSMPATSVSMGNEKVDGECGISYDLINSEGKRLYQNTQNFAKLNPTVGETKNHPIEFWRRVADRLPYYVIFPSIDGPNHGIKSESDKSFNFSAGTILLKDKTDADSVSNLLKEISTLCGKTSTVSNWLTEREGLKSLASGSDPSTLKTPTWLICDPKDADKKNGREKYWIELHTKESGNSINYVITMVNEDKDGVNLNFSGTTSFESIPKTDDIYWAGFSRVQPFAWDVYKKNGISYDFALKDLMEQSKVKFDWIVQQFQFDLVRSDLNLRVSYFAENTAKTPMFSGGYVCSQAPADNVLGELARLKKALSERKDALTQKVIEAKQRAAGNKKI